MCAGVTFAGAMIGVLIVFMDVIGVMTRAGVIDAGVMPHASGNDKSRS